MNWLRPREPGAKSVAGTRSPFLSAASASFYLGGFLVLARPPVSCAVLWLSQGRGTDRTGREVGVGRERQSEVGVGRERWVWAERD